MQKFTRWSFIYLLLLNMTFADGFWDDYKSPAVPGVNQTFGGNVQNLVSGLFEVFKWLWLISFIISIAAFIFAVLKFVFHAEDTPHLKEAAKHDIYAQLMTMSILGGVGLFINIILSLLFG